MTNRDALALADDFFLVVLDDRTGRLRLSTRVAAIGLAGCRMTELIFTGNIEVTSGRLTVCERPPPAERLAKQTLGRLLTEPGLVDVREWLAYFAETSVDAVADRLTRGGWIVPSGRRGLRRGPVTFRPTDVSRAAWRAMRLRDTLATRRTLTWSDVALAGVVSATGFLETVLWDLAADTGRGYVTETLTMLRQRSPGLYDLISQVQALTGDAVLSHRA